MRLLHTSTWKLEEFIGRDIPKYAILSHRWEEDEVTFQDLQQRLPTGEQPKKGWSKLKGCRAQAVRDGLEWVWIDTCCIDKSSSAELSEAINSMFNWYREADVCYAYLSDVPTGSDLYLRDGHFRCSKWFTRGWTLQELLAPGNLIFFNRQWEGIGTKKELSDLVSEITGIKHLQGFKEACVAQKMSWASKRETTRVEDMAYSLMGIFEVNMPPLYGEGSKAFIRLQKEILNNSDDESIFAWKDPEDLTGGLLARSPAAFRLSGDVRRYKFDLPQPHYLMTNKGLRIESVLQPVEDPSSLFRAKLDTFMFTLQCLEGSFWPTIVGLILRRISGNQFARICPDQLVEGPLIEMSTLQNPKSRTVFYIKQPEDSEPVLQGPYEFRVSKLTSPPHTFAIQERYSSIEWRSRWSVSGLQTGTLTTDQLHRGGMTAGLLFSSSNHDKFVLFIIICEHRVSVGVLIPEDRYLFKNIMEVITKLPVLPSEHWQTAYRSQPLMPEEIITAELSKEASTEGPGGRQKYSVHIKLPEKWS